MYEISGSASKETRNQPSYFPEPLTSKEDLVRFWSTFLKNNGWDTANQEGLQRAAERYAKESIDEQKDPDARRFFGIRDSDKIFATGMVRILRLDADGKVDLENGKKTGYVGFLSVNKLDEMTDAQKKVNEKKKFSQSMMEYLGVYAAAEGCEEILSSVMCDNVKSLLIQLRNGIRLKQLVTSNKGGETSQWFNLIYPLTNRPDKEGSSREIKEVPLSDLPTISNLLKDGWEGIKVHNTDPKKESEDPKDWILTMEK